MSGIRRQQTLPSALAATISTRRPWFWPNQEAFLLADSDCEQPNVLRPSSVPVLSCVCPGKRLAEMIATRHKTIWLLTVAIPLFMTRAEPSQTIRRQCRTHTKLPESNNTKKGIFHSFANAQTDQPARATGKRHGRTPPKTPARCPSKKGPPAERLTDLTSKYASEA